MKKKTHKPRGVNQDTAFAEYWESVGKLHASMLGNRLAPPMEYMRSAFRFGWDARRARDAKLRRAPNGKENA